MGWYGLDPSESGLGAMEGFCEHGNEPSGSITFWEVLEWLHNWQLLKKGSAPLSKHVTILSGVRLIVNLLVLRPLLACCTSPG
jgi:hypothetical protein